MQNQPSVPDFSLDQLVPYFQPIMDLASQSVWRYECLARMVTLEQRTFSPSQFLYLIERDGKCHELTETMFNRSAEYFRDLHMPWNINLSGQDMTNKGLMHYLTAYFEDYPNHKRVGVELTAEAALQHEEAFRAFLLFCKTLGIGVYLDHVSDAALAHSALYDLPLDGIKIDANRLLTEREKPVFKQLSERAKEQNMAIIAEHVEDETTLEALKLTGVRYAQGFYFSQPKANT